MLLALPVIAQVQEEVAAPSHIRSIDFRGPSGEQFPIVKLGEPVTLKFDDLTAREQDYYYKIVHCDYDWTPSQLLKSQYLTGMDNQRIIDYRNSYNTLQPYSHYRLTLPNNQVQFKVSGNYVLEIYNRGGTKLFSRRFLVYEDLVPVSAQVRRARDFKLLDEAQTLQISVRTDPIRVVNPRQQFKIALVQNYHWPSAIYGVPPQYTIGRELVYRYDEETRFPGGNEFLNFDTKDLRAPTVAIEDIFVDDLYNHVLFPNKPRKERGYTYFPDVNGDFVIRTLQGRDPDREGEYTRVHFALRYEPELELKDIYIYGKFNNYQLLEDNRLILNSDTGLLEKTLVLKQGFYNYKYAVKNPDGSIDPNYIGGNFYVAENQYHIFVYYREFGDFYDRLVGLGTTSSRVVTN